MCVYMINPIVMNGLSHPYHLDESIFIFRGIRSIFSSLFHFSMKFMSANRIAPDGTPQNAASHLGLFCLPMSHKKDARLLWVNILEFSSYDDFLLVLATWCSEKELPVKILNFQTPNMFAVITLKFKQRGLSTDRIVQKVRMEWQTV